MENLIIPVAIQICLDDVGWDKGTDMRVSGGQSRTGIPRFHEYEDYEAVEMLGRALNQRILCALCVMDWDKDNLLRGQRGITHMPDTWDRAAEIDIPKMERFAAFLKESRYTEIALHGVSHGAYTDGGKRIHESEFFRNKTIYDLDRSLPLEKWDFDRRMELFFKIYNSWDFGKRVRTFVAPGGTCGTETEDLLPLANWLRGIGIEYWYDSFSEKQSEIFALGGLPCLHASYKSPKSPKWDIYDFDPIDLLPPFHEEGSRPAGYGMHWPNILRFNPKKNATSVALWIDFFMREAEKFGTMIARDVAFATEQAFYHYFAKVERTAAGYRLDLSAARAEMGGKRAPLYISVKKGILPRAAKGTVLSLYEVKKEFDTYEIRSESDIIEINI